MSGPLPHTIEIQKMMETYLDDALDMVQNSTTYLKGTSQFRTIFRISLAADATLSKLASSNMRPPLSAARSIIKRIPYMVALRQISVATIELRRYTELMFWCIYFTNHPVEWACFEGKPDKGYVKSLDNPIDFCAHRDLTFYINYAYERMAPESSGIAREAINLLRQILGELNSEVHAGRLASIQSRKLPVDEVSTGTLQAFSKTQRRVLSQTCVLLAAFNRRMFDRLPPMYRAHFDWLIGANLRKRIRSGSFGL